MFIIETYGGSLVCGVGIDGMFMEKSHTALVPSKFIISFEGESRFNGIYTDMANIMFTNNLCKYNILVYVIKGPRAENWATIMPS